MEDTNKDAMDLGIASVYVYVWMVELMGVGMLRDQDGQACDNR
jgi:hypothetical protein